VYKNLEYYEDKGLFLFLYYTVIKVNVDIAGKEKQRKLDGWKFMVEIEKPRKYS